MGNNVSALSEPADGQMMTGNPDAFTLLFRRGERPDAAAMVRCLARAREAGFRVRASEEAELSEGLLEVTAAGLTFDLGGLAPGAALPAFQPLQWLGFEGSPDRSLIERVEVRAGNHIRAGASLHPVMKVMTSLVAALALDLPVRAVGWGPSGILMEPGYFCRMVLGWLGGGLFPARGLVALVPAPDGGLTSRGLSAFIGQEIQMEGASADSVQVAQLVIDDLVKRGGMNAPGSLSVGARKFLVEPSRFGKRLHIWGQDD